LFVNGSATAQLVDADGAAAGAEPVDYTVNIDLSGAGTEAIDFGNGLSVTVAQSSAAGTASGTVDYSSGSSTYTLRLSSVVDGDQDLEATDTAASFAQFMTDINSKLDIVSGQLAQIGALNGRLTFKEDQISVAQINTEGAYNRIMNANMAEEQVNASKFLILQQTATAMLAQANAAPQFLLSLFR
jgi:flagellin